MLLQERLKNIPIILGSKSPRRNDLLASMDIAFDVEVKDTDEGFDSTLSAVEVVKNIAANKLLAFQADEYADKLIICADTIVVNTSGDIIGKPSDLNEAKYIIQSLQGKPHVVYTGVAIGFQGKQYLFVEETKVWFNALNLEEIAYYVDNYKPLDKAGSYGIQEWVGRIGIQRIEGSYENVIGLPTARLHLELKKIVGL